MLKLFVKALGFMAALVLSGAASAVSMGSINVATALGEPLKAEIGLSDLGKGGKSGISVRMASPEAFKEAGLDYPAGLPKLKFQVESNAGGDAYLSVTSAQPVNEPFVNLLVELIWPSGKLLRSYTFLLDPPGFKPEQPKAEPVQPLVPSVASAPEPKVVEPVNAPPAPVAEPAEKMPAALAPVPAPAPVAQPAAKPVASSNIASGPIEVKRGDSLSKIAREVKPSDVSLEQMLVAMYRANEAEFDGHNMNRLRTGKILRMPEAGDLNEVAQVEAVAEIRAQVADWHAYRQKLAAAGGTVADEAPRQEASGKIATTVADKTPPAKESAKEVVRLSKGEAPGDKAAAGGSAKSVQDKLHAMQEEAIARDKMLKDSYERIAILEKNIKEMQRLLELKGQPVPAEKPAETKPEPAKPVAAPDAVSVTPLPPALPQAKPKKAAPPPPPPSLVDELLGEPIYLAGGAAVLLGLLGGLAFIAKRRKGGRAGAGKDKLSDTGSHIAEPVAPSPDTGDFTLGGTAVAAPAAADDVDPLKEADLFLSFGRDAQAEDILKDALAKSPANQEIRLKLLSIYANRADAKTFSVIAQQVRDSGDEAAWERAAEMGRKLDPANPVYGADENTQAAEAVDDESTLTQSSSSLDFDLGSGAPEETVVPDETGMPVDETEATSSGLDFDLGTGAAEELATDDESALTPDKATTDTASVMDFDLGLDQAVEPASGEDKPQGGASDEVLDFDITAEHPSLSEQQEEEKEPAVSSLDSDDLVFDVTGMHPVAEEAASAVAEPEVTPEAVQEAAEPAGLGEITLDFPGAEEEQAAEETAEPVREAALDLGDISLDLGTPEVTPQAAPAEKVKDARWHDVATKLDLARAYQEMGDASGAKEILEEVLKEGDAQQKAMAQSMIQQL